MTQVSSSQASLLACENGPLKRVHHIAYVVRDHAQTRQFYEDILGMPLVAAWAEIAEFPEFPGRPIEYMHTFFEMGDGAAVAFFGFADEDVYQAYKREQCAFIHFSMKVSAEYREAMEQKLLAKNLPHFSIDHGYVHSLYVPDPDGLIVEFSSDPENADAIADWQKKTARTHWEKWLSGDRTPNNDLRQALDATNLYEQVGGS